MDPRPCSSTAHASLALRLVTAHVNDFMPDPYYYPHLSSQILTKPKMALKGRSAPLRKAFGNCEG